MITIQQTEKIAEMAKLEITEDELLKMNEELDKMANFAHEVSRAADEIEDINSEPMLKQRDESRSGCEMDQNLAECGMHIRDSFFRIKAGSKNDDK